MNWFGTTKSGYSKSEKIERFANVSLYQSFHINKNQIFKEQLS